jgi:large subunit ribosomal protein L19
MLLVEDASVRIPEYMANQAKWNGTTFSVGDTVRVHQKLIEEKDGEKKERLQVFEGMVIKIRGRDDSKTFTVRKIGANRIGVERVWPLGSPWIGKLEVVNKGRVRRGKLYYVREKSRKELRRITQR